MKANTHLSLLVAAATEGEPIVIARAGKPLVKVIAVDAQVSGRNRRLGFMEGDVSVPDDFDRLGTGEMVALFEDGA